MIQAPLGIKQWTKRMAYSRAFNAWLDETESQPITRYCEYPGCDCAGEYPAPRSRFALRDFIWFCLDHVRAYNASWNYYAELSPDEIEAVLKADMVWHRATRPLGDREGPRYANGMDHLFVEDPFGVADAYVSTARSGAGHLPREVQKALHVMNLSWPLDVAALKHRYKELVRQHHPDLNLGCTQAEARLKDINAANALLRQVLEGQYRFQAR